MLYNTHELNKLIRIVCENVNASEGTFYKSKLLDFIRFLIYLNGKTIKKNQIQILKIMQDDDFTQILIPNSEEIIEEHVRSYQEMNGNFNGTVKMSQELLYLVTYWQIMTSLIDENNDVNIGKLVKTYPFENLVQFVKKSGNCWPLKRNIRAFLNRIYYFTPGTSAYLQAMILEEIPSIIDDLDAFISLKTGPDAKKF